MLEAPSKKEVSGRCCCGGRGKNPPVAAPGPAPGAGPGAAPPTPNPRPPGPTPMAPVPGTKYRPSDPKDGRSGPAANPMLTLPPRGSARVPPRASALG